LVIYPANKRLLELLVHGEGSWCIPGCPLCTRYRNDLSKYDYTDPATPRARWKPCLHTCKSGGSDGLTAELLRFSRAADHKARWEERMALCTALAALFNRWLENGTPTSHGFRHSVITTILKRAPPGAPPPDPKSTDDTRGLAVENMLPKLFELVILARLTHWAVNQNIVSISSQLGFMPLLGAEMHVLTLLETLKMRRAVGLDTYALFVDIKGAYDNVPQEALWHILRRAGVPSGSEPARRNPKWTTRSRPSL